MRLAALLLAGASLAIGADPAVQRLFGQVRDKVLDSTSRVPRYTCVQTINRNQYRPQYSAPKPAGCDALIAARRRLVSAGALTWRDRLRLDVAVLNGQETLGERRLRFFSVRRLRH